MIYKKFNITEIILLSRSIFSAHKVKKIETGDNKLVINECEVVSCEDSSKFIEWDRG